RAAVAQHEPGVAGLELDHVGADAAAVRHLPAEHPAEERTAEWQARAASPQRQDACAGCGGSHAQPLWVARRCLAICTSSSHDVPAALPRIMDMDPTIMNSISGTPTSTPAAV